MTKSSSNRFLIGIGIGAEYPCGSVSAAEQSEEENIHKFAQHRWVALATCQFLITQPVVPSGWYLTLRCYDHIWAGIRCFYSSRAFLDVCSDAKILIGNFDVAIRFGNNHLRAIWRLSLGLGSVPAALVFLWRLNMDEPTRYKKDSMKRVKIPYKLVFKRYWASLSAISAIWCERTFRMNANW